MTQPVDLRLVRVKLGLSVIEMARELGIPRETWYRWENAHIRIQHPRILQLALLGLEEEMKRGQSNEQSNSG
jgi:transcriptional regulator with XRE-family HTH domain